jgi:moderate conductance mechanosensitive channel
MKLGEQIVNFIGSSKFYGPIIIILVAILLNNIIAKILEKATINGKTEIEKKKRKTILILFQNIMKYVIAIIAILMILNIYGINTTSILAGLGIAGVVIGLALQDALKDIIGGINIIMDNYYVVGDLVNYNNFIGTIIAFGLKTTKIQNYNGEVLVVANRNIDKVINLSQKKSVIVLTIPTAYECDHKKVEKVLKDIIDKVSKYDYVESSGCEYLGIDELASSSINYSFAIKCNQGKQFALKREILTMVKEAYEKNDIKIPYNQIEVHNGSKI